MVGDRLSTKAGALMGLWLLGLGCTDTPQHRKTTAEPESLAERGDDGCTDSFPADALPVSEADEEMLIERVYMEDALPEKLSETPLYEDIVAKTVHPALQLYRPEFELWSDGADKQRWVYIPECSSVDTTDMNNWDVPVGTRFFKEFSVEGKRIETRIISRISEGPRDFAYASYLWNTAETEATRVDIKGIENALGTSHDVPSKDACFRCHGSHALGGGRPSRGLGFSAIQLAHADSGLDLFAMAEAGVISHAPERLPTIPGDDTERAALGYLHANCGNCHNDSKDRIPQVTLDLWLNVGLSSVEETAAWRTAVDQPTQLFKDQHVSGRAIPGNPTESAMLYRMAQRGNNAQMPPLATEVSDPEGIAVVSDWIEGLE